MKLPFMVDRPAWFGVAAFLALATLYSVWIGVRFGFNSPPSTSGDELSYDSMAWELSRGRGFSMNVHDAEFRRPYHEASVKNPELYAITPIPAGPIAYRPPLFSTVFAATNLIGGRQFYLIRIFNVLCVAATGALLAWFLIRETGLLSAAIMLFLFLADVRPRLYARAILTEPLACLLCTLLCLVLLKCNRERRVGGRSVILLGILTGLSILTRSIVVVWLPGLAVLLWWIQQNNESTNRLKLRNSFYVIAVAILITVPWAIRNVRLLERFAPTGTQGQMELAAGYSDAAWEHFGVWQNLAARGDYDGIAEAELSPAQRELAVADESSRRAFKWMAENPSRLPILGCMKILSELKPNTVVETILLFTFGIGLLFASDRSQLWCICGFIAVNLFAIAATWSVEGRFLVPQLFAFYAVGGLGLGGLIGRKSENGEQNAGTDFINADT